MKDKSIIHNQRNRNRKALSAGIVLSLFIASLIFASDALQIPDSIRRWHEAPHPGSSNILTALKQGKDAFAEERYSAALEILPGGEEAKNLLLGDYIVLYRAKSNFQLKRYQEALADFRFLESQFPYSRFHDEAFLGQCRILLELKDAGAVLDLLDKNRQYSGSEAAFCKARAMEIKGSKEQAIELYLQIYSQYASSYSAGQAEKALLSLAPKALKGANNYHVRLQRAENLMRANNIAGTRALLVALGKYAAPDKKIAQKRKLLLAEAEYKLDKTAAALAILKTAAAAVDPSLHAKYLYLEGACRRRLKQEGSFIALRDKALALHPKSPDTEELCYSAATYFDVEYESDKAADAYRVLYRAFPKGRYAERALWKTALADYFKGQWNEAAGGFWEYLQKYSAPLYASSAMYWMGRCYVRSGNTEEARYLFRRSQALANDSYYGGRAREAEATLDRSVNETASPAAGIDFGKVRIFCDSIKQAPAVIAEPDIDGIRILEKARHLAAAELPDLALAELRWGIKQHPQNLKQFYYVIALINADRDDFNSVFSAMKRAFPDYSSIRLDAVPDDVLYMLYPVRFGEIIASRAAAAGLNQAFILGVIRQESGFKSNAQSPANARGLMQLLPSTALRLARNAGLPRSTAKNLFDVENNIRLGTLHFSYLMKKYGKEEPVLAAYNAGESRSDRWLKEFGHDDMAEYVEQIPFSETRNYVKQILSNQYHYEAILSRGTSSGF